MNITNIHSNLGFMATYYEKDNKRYCDVEVQNERLHIRPCTKITKLTRTIPDKYCRLLYTDKDGLKQDVDALSYLKILFAGLKKGSKATIVATMNCPKQLFLDIAALFERVEDDSDKEELMAPY